MNGLNNEEDQYLVQQIELHMNMKFTLVSILVLVHCELDGQTLNQANTGPIPGDTYTVQRGPYAAQGASGNGQTWDHSDLISLGATSFGYVTPASTGVATSFPGSTVALPFPGVPGSYVFYNVTSTGLYQLGARQSGSTLFYNDSEMLIPFPCSFGTTWVDDFTSNYTNGGQPGLRSGFISGEADATGTLILPYGSIQNVIRLHITESSEDYISGVPYFTYDSDHYLYYKPGFHGPIFGIYQTTSSTFGNPTEVNYTQWADADDVSVQDLIENSIGVEVFPIPADDRMTINFSSQGGTIQFDVVDLHGRTIHQETRSASSGLDQHVLDVSRFAPGIYHLRLTNNNGETGIHRLVVE